MRWYRRIVFRAPWNCHKFYAVVTAHEKLGAFAQKDPHAQEAFRHWAEAQELFVRELARTMKPHANVVGFDLGSEIDTCWQAPTQVSDAWMARMFALMDEVFPRM